MTQQVERQLIAPGMLLQVCHTMMQGGEAAHALELMRMAYERMADVQRIEIAHTLGVMLLNQNQPRQAKLYFEVVLDGQPSSYSTWLHLAFAEILTGQIDRAKLALNMVIPNNQSTLSAADANLASAIINKLK